MRPSNNVLFMGKKGIPLPYDAEIEYLQSTSEAGQYINTGILFDTLTTKIEITTTIKRWSTSTVFAFGCMSNATSASQISIQHASRGTYPKIRYLDAFNTASTVSTYNTDVPYTYQVSSTKFCLYDISGNLIQQATSAGATMQPLNLAIYLYGCNNAGTLKYISPNQRVKSFKIWKGDVLVQDLTPVRVGTEGCMYDKVTSTIFHNAGTGDFILGNDKN